MEFSGTSMASRTSPVRPRCCPATPAWTVAQIKSALVQTGADSTKSNSRVAGPQFQGGGVVSLARADRPLLFAEPTGVSLGLLAPRADGDEHVAARGCRRRCRHLAGLAVSRGTPRGARLVVPATVDSARRAQHRGDGRAGPHRATSTATSSSGAALRRGGFPSGDESSAGALAEHAASMLCPGRALSRTTSGSVSRLPLPLPGGHGRNRCHDALRGPSGFSHPGRKAGRELGVVVTQRHEEPCRAAHRRRARREPADGLRRTSGRPQPVLDSSALR